MKISKLNKKIKKFYLKKNNILKFIAAGSIDDGKSTLIGRLLYDNKNIFSDQINSISLFKYKYFLKKNIDFSLLVDGLKSEREQGITIDVAYRYFFTSKRKFIIADTPGHKQYTHNMITGASVSDIAIIIIDASKIKYSKYNNINILNQTKKHFTILSLLNIQHIIIVINKIDLLDYSEIIYNKIINSFLIFCKKKKITNISFLPISALYGENIIYKKNKKLSWYKGKTLIQILETIPIVEYFPSKPLRFPIQLIMKYNQNKKKNLRGYMGQIKSGKLKINDKILLFPNKKKITIKKINIFNKSFKNINKNNSITIFLKENYDINRGDMFVSYDKKPFLYKIFKAYLYWLSENKFNINNKYILKQTTKQVVANILKIENILNIKDQKIYFSNNLKINNIAKVTINIQDNIIFDKYNNIKSTGSFILINKNNNQTIAAGLIC